MRVSDEAATMLVLGERGTLDTAAFVLAGRTCLRGRRGTRWNEWTLRFDDGRTAFLAEADGSFTSYEERTLVPSLDSITVGSGLDTGFVVVERGRASRVARWGKVEDAPDSYDYVHLSSRTGESATIDFGSPAPRVFVGRTRSLRELGLAPREVVRFGFIPTLDLSRPKGVETWLEMGDEGDLEGARLRVVGVVARSTGAGEARVTWEEYFLVDAVDASAGVRWLVVSAGHWSIVEGIAAGTVVPAESLVSLDGIAYEHASYCTARVDWASGELPWDVTIGETSNVSEFVNPPWILTREWTDDELSWSRSTWVAPEVIAKAFGKRALPKPVGRAPHEPLSSTRT